MESLGPSPFLWLRFGKDGGLEAGASELQAALSSPSVRELVVISHGWKNDEDAAWALYSELWANTCPALKAIDPRQVLVAGVQWPARRYAPPLDSAALRAAAAGDGRTQSASEGQPVRDLTDSEFQALLETLLEGRAAGDADAVIAAARAYARGGGANEAAELMLSSTPKGLASPSDPELAADAEGLLNAAAAPERAMAALAGVPSLTVEPQLGGAAGLDDAIQAWLGGRRAGVIRWLEQLSYFEMKSRAGLVGATLGQALSGLAPAGPVRLHLVGHSFGARVVTAAANAFQPHGMELHSLTLLQAAFSHNGFSSARGGAFASAPSKVSGAISVTHTHNDQACTLAYALASRLSRDARLAIGDAKDRYGAMGANGAQFETGEAASLMQWEASGDFAPRPGHINNFRADGFIKSPPDPHCDVRNPTVGALLAATLQA